MRTFPFFSLQADAKPPLKRRALGHGILQQSSAVGFVVCCGCMLPFTFQNVSLPTHVNFDSGVLSDLDSSSRLFTFTKGSGSYVRFRPRLCSSTCPWARLATHRRIGSHFVCLPCSHAHFGRATTACVSSPKRLGCLHELAHAAGHGHFQSTSSAPILLFECRSRQKTTIPNIGDNESVPTRVFRSARPHVLKGGCYRRNRFLRGFRRQPE